MLVQCINSNGHSIEQGTRIEYVKLHIIDDNKALKTSADKEVLPKKKRSEPL